MKKCFKCVALLFCVPSSDVFLFLFLFFFLYSFVETIFHFVIRKISRSVLVIFRSLLFFSFLFSSFLLFLCFLSDFGFSFGCLLSTKQNMYTVAQNNMHIIKWRASHYYPRGSWLVNRNRFDNQREYKYMISSSS